MDDGLEYPAGTGKFFNPPTKRYIVAKDFHAEPTHAIMDCKHFGELVIREYTTGDDLGTLLDASAGYVAEAEKSVRVHFADPIHAPEPTGAGEITSDDTDSTERRRKPLAYPRSLSRRSLRPLQQKQNHWSTSRFL